MPILPNFLPLLLELDPSIPTYIGSSLGRWPGYAYYFQGMMYGFNWGVVCPYLLVGADGVVAGLTKAAKIRTLATADLGDEIQTRRLDEDAYTGMLMVSPSLYVVEGGSDRYTLDSTTSLHGQTCRPPRPSTCGSKTPPMGIPRFRFPQIPGQVWSASTWGRRPDRSINGGLPGQVARLRGTHSRLTRWVPSYINALVAGLTIHSRRGFRPSKMSQMPSSALGAIMSGFRRLHLHL